MKVKIVLLSIATTLLLSTNSIAASITTHFIMQIESIRGDIAESIWNVGDSVSFTATYDNAGIIMHQWHDGKNGIGEQGQGDDKSAGVDVLRGNVWDFWSDAIVEVDDKLKLFFKPDTVMQSAIQNNASCVTGNSNTFILDYNSDGFGIYFETQNSGVNWQGVAANYNGLGTRDAIFFSEVTAVATPIPESASILLLGLGLLGLVGVSRKKIWQ